MSVRDWFDDEPVTLEKKEEFDYVLEAFSGVELGSGWNRRACPRCRDMDGKEDHKSSLGLNTATMGYSCFKCGMSGKLPPSYVAQIQDEDPVDRAIRQSKSEVEEAPKVEVELCEAFMPVFEEPGWSSFSCEFARAYLLGKRGLRPQACYEAGVGAALVGKLAGRIVVPIPNYADLAKPWRGWVAREAMGRPTSMPYWYAKGMIRIGLLYNEPALSVETDEPCYIVEGTLDAIALWPDAVAVLGKPLESQFDLLLQASRPLVVCLDGDAWVEGQSLAWKLQHRGKRAGNVKLPPKVDPDEIPRGWLDEEARRVLV